ncbi:MAG TPA: sigma-54 dependent transcriptional regulator [Vicinamibacterales bacterium]|nr:sigma-54 dependent transcriptional regulator [Vicinamibacterales bacterium]
MGGDDSGNRCALSTTRSWQRGVDRRRGFSTVVEAIVAMAPISCEPRAVRQRFEEAMRDLIGARSVDLRDRSGLTNRVARAVSFDVNIGVALVGRLDVVFEKGRVVDAWTAQTLERARHLAALVLILERLYRAAGPVVVRQDGAAPLIGSSRGISLVRERIERVAATDFTVLIEGESGVGKELVARQIHELSRRSAGPFVAVNCAAIVETLLEAELFGIEERTATGVRGRRGKFEHAHDGTLFLDEVADLSPAAQAKLLRAIQDVSVERVGGVGVRRVDTRIIAATNKKLSDLVEHGRFRLDLFYRLNGVEIEVPPLRERRDDVLELAEYFLARHGATRPLRLAQTAADALLAYEWPGNVRELERIIERAVALAASDVLELDDLPSTLLGGYVEHLRPSLQARHTLREWGSRYVRLVLEHCDNNKRRACRELGISYHTLEGYLQAGRPRRGPGLVAGEPPAG